MAVDHESYHAIQIALFGYLYRFAVTLDVIIKNSIESLASQQATSYDALFTAISEGITHSDLYRNIIRDLRRVPEGSVSVLDLVEGLTYCSQMAGVVQHQADAYLELLDESQLPEEYVRAYRHFHDRVGSACNAVRVFPTAAHFSLCSHSPPECFAMLTEAFRTGALSLKTYLPDIIAYCREHDPDYRGFSWEFRDALGQPFPNHPTFGPIRDFFLSHPKRSEIFSKYLLKPDTLDFKTRLDLAVDLVLLRADPDPHAPGFRKWRMLNFKPTDDPHQLSARVLMAAISRRLMGTVSVPLE
jgi:hypothetical protein